MVKRILKKIKDFSMARQITYLSDVYLITCVVESGNADEIVKAASDVGAQGATINYAR